MRFSFHERQLLRAATGWLELGNPDEAFNELEKITPFHRAHPDVLKLRWRIYDSAGKHQSAFGVAQGLSRLLPDDAEPFVWRSYSARRMKGGGLGLALELLLDVVNDFPGEPILPFNIACYHCQRGDLNEAKTWLHTAYEVAGRNGTLRYWKTKTLDDDDLAELRKQNAL